MMETAIAFIIIFGAIVFFHELGHFLLRKQAGIMVREFAIGMGPKIFAIQKVKHFIQFDYCLLVDMFEWLEKIWIQSNFSQAFV